MIDVIKRTTKKINNENVIALYIFLSLLKIFCSKQKNIQGITIIGIPIIRTKIEPPPLKKLGYKIIVKKITTTKQSAKYIMPSLNNLNFSFSIMPPLNKQY